MYHWHQDTYWIYKKRQYGTFVRHRPSSWTPNQNCVPVTSVCINDTEIRIHPRTVQRPEKPTSQHPITFDEYVQMLNPWERELLCDIHFSSFPYEIIHLLTSSTPPPVLYMVSDGSHRSGTISYGWVCGTSDGRILAEHSGYAYGNPTSHRAEAWGMLSATIFLHHLHTYTGPISGGLINPLCFFADNAGLIHRIKQRSAYKTPYPNSTLATDWDLIEQIYLSSSQLPFPDISYEWVRGHQDSTSQTLTVKARFNIRADELPG